jgi:hypothetical protein
VSPNNETGVDDNVRDSLANSFVIPSLLALITKSGMSYLDFLHTKCIEKTA